MAQHWRWLWLLVFLAHGPVWAVWPQALVASSVPVQVWVDPTASATILDVSQPEHQAQFQPVAGTFAGGFGRHVYWFRFELPAPDAPRMGLPTWLLEVRPTYLDDVRLYLPQSNGSGHFDEFRHGDRLPFAERLLATRTFVQPVVMESAEHWVVYARLETSSSAVFSLRAWRPAQFLAAATAEYALLGILVGAFLFALLGQLPSALRRDDPLTPWFLAYVLAGLLIVVGVQGLAAQFVFPSQPLLAAHLTPFSSTLLVFTATGFYRLALKVREWSPWIDRFFMLVMGIALLTFPAPWVGYYPEVARFQFPALLLVLLLGAVRCVQLIVREEPDARWLLTGVLATFAGAIPAVLALLGLVSGEFLTSYVYQVGILVSVVAIQTALNRRARRAEEALQTSQQQAVQARALAQEQQAVAQQQRRFIDMLTHELKSPLSVIWMRLRSPQPSPQMEKHAIQALQDINVLIERIALSGRLEYGDLPFQPVACRMDEVVMQCMESIPEDSARLRVKLGQAASEQPIVHADPMWLRIVCSNLLDNALKYADPEAMVDIILGTQVSRQGMPGWSLQVRNPVGKVGRPEPSQLFQKYYRSPGAHTRIGTGLGLHIVRTLCESMGGSLVYRAEANDVIFELWLPQ